MFFPQQTSPEQPSSAPLPVAAPAAPVSTASSPLLQLEGIRATFTTRKGLFRHGQVHALNGVNLSIRRGETVALVGESGSGKTTLGRVSLRLTHATAGRIIFDGRDITDADESDLGWFRKRAQIIFQDPFSSLNPYMTVGDVVAEPLVIDGVKDAAERHARVLKALEAVELQPAARTADKYPTQLSGGQRQRVGIARALIRNPDYIVADEPVSMIDASSRVGILDLLQQLGQERGVAYLFITHDIASARFFADRIAVMYLGNIIEQGSAEQVIERPLHPYTQALIAAIPEPDPANRFRRRAVVPGEQISAANLPTGCPFHPRCPQIIHGVCEVETPHLIEMPDDPGHFVACHLYPPSESYRNL